MDSIRSAIETASGRLAEHPEAAVSTDAAATAVREEGLRFRVEGPKGQVTSDMAKSVGGGETADPLRPDKGDLRCGEGYHCTPHCCFSWGILTENKRKPQRVFWLGLRRSDMDR